MTTAKITKREGYRCCPDGHTMAVFEFGAIVEGQVAEWALADKAASRMFDPRTDKQAGVLLEGKNVQPAKPKSQRKAPKKG